MAHYLTEFFDITVNQNTLYEPILHASPPATIFAFERTCKAARACVQAYQRSAFNINKHLAYFLIKPTAFRSMQSTTGTTVSGSNVLQFMDRTHYTGTDLDIYVNPGHGVEVGMHMLKTQGYRVVEHNGDGTPDKLNLVDSVRHVVAVGEGVADQVANTMYRRRSIHLVCQMERVTKGGRKLQVQIIVTSDCVFHAIMNFHSSMCVYTRRSWSSCLLRSVCYEHHNLR